MKTLINRIQARIAARYTSKIKKDNINKLFEFIFKSPRPLEKEDISEYIFQTKKEISMLYDKLLRNNKSDFFYSILDQLEWEKKNTNDDSCKEILSLMEYYYYSLENDYVELALRHEVAQRVNVDYSPEAYNSKATVDSTPLKDNSFYAMFHPYNHGYPSPSEK